MLTYDIRLGGYVVDLDRRRLEGAPSYTSRETPNWDDRSYTRRIDQTSGPDRAPLSFGPIVPPKILSHRRRLVPMAEMGPAFAGKRREANS